MSIEFRSAGGALAPFVDAAPQGVGATAYLGLVAFAMLIALSPGPSNVLLLAVGGRVGVARGLPLLGGMALGYALLWMLATLAVASAVQLGPETMLAARWLGAAAMLWFAVRLLGSLAQLDGDTGSEGSSVPRGGVRPLDGVLFQFVNPKAWLSAYAAAAMFGAGDAALLRHALAAGAVAGTAVLVGCGAWLVAGHLGSNWLRAPLAGSLVRVGLLGSIAVSVAPVLLG